MPALFAGIFEYRRRLPIREGRLRAAGPILVSDGLGIHDQPAIILLFPTGAGDPEAIALVPAGRFNFDLLLDDGNPAIRRRLNRQL